MTPDVRVRPATPEDAPAIAAISLEVDREGTSGSRRPEETRTAEQDAQGIRDAEPDFMGWLVAEVEGQVVGMLTVKRWKSLGARHVAEVGIAVAAAQRGRGIGRALMLAAESWARERGVDRMTLGVLAHNERARRLYRGLGYHEEGLRESMYRLADGRLVDEVLMAKWLGELTVRRARPEDAEATVAIVREAASEPRPTIALHLGELRTPQQQAALIRAADPERQCWLVAESRGEVVGVLTAERGARPAFRHVAELGLTVRASHRGRGVGRALMLACEAWARGLGLRRLTLAVIPWNERGVRLYRSLGYVEEGVLRAHIVTADGTAHDELLMAKEVR